MGSSRGYFDYFEDIPGTDKHVTLEELEQGEYSQFFFFGNHQQEHSQTLLIALYLNSRFDKENSEDGHWKRVTMEEAYGNSVIDRLTNQYAQYVKFCTPTQFDNLKERDQWIQRRNDKVHDFLQGMAKKAAVGVVDNFSPSG